MSTDEIDKLAANFKTSSDTQDAILANDGPDGLNQRRLAVETESTTIKSTLGEKQRLFLLYREQLTDWEKRRAALVGDKGAANTEQWIVAEIAGLDALPARRDDLRKNRVAQVREIHQQLRRIVAEYRLLYQPVQGFVGSPENVDMALPLAFNVRIAEDSFQEGFLGRINRQTRGSFAGVEESASRAVCTGRC